MDITVTDPATLKDAAGWAAAGIAHRPVQFWESAIGLRWDGTVLALTAFDGEVAATTAIPARHTADDHVTGPDALAEQAYVFGPTLVRIAAQLPREPVRLRTSDDGGTLTITCGPSEWIIRTVPDEGTIPEFPRIPPAAGTTPAAMLQIALRAVLPSVATDKKVPESLHHVNLTITSDTGPAMLTAWATNRYMCGMMPCPWIPAEGVPDASVLVPRRVAEVMARDAEGDVTILLDRPGAGAAALMGFQFAGRTLVARLLDQDFPDMRRHFAFPGVTAVIELDADELGRTLKRVGVATAKEDFPRVAFRITGDLAEVTAGTEDKAMETVVVKARRPGEDRQDGPPADPVELSIAFNADLLAAAVGAVPGAQVVALRYTGPAKPVGITDGEATAASGGYGGVLMPFSAAA